MIDSPLISIVIVNYNYGCYLRDCLESVLRQDYIFWECVLVDNASTDGSREIFAAFCDEEARGVRDRFSLLSLSKNEHQTGASIAGFKRSQGLYVIFLDADDLLLPDCLRTHIQAHLSLREGAGFTCGDMLQICGTQLAFSTAAGVGAFLQSADLSPIAEPRRLPEVVAVAKGLSELEQIDLRSRLFFIEGDAILQWPWSATSAFCYRREAVGLMFAYSPAITGSTDAYLAHGIAALTGGVLIDRPVAAYRLHGRNIFSHTPPLRGFFNFDVAQEGPTTRRIAIEIINSYLCNVERIAHTAKDKRLFFEAVTRLSRISSGLKPQLGIFSSFMLEFLVTNRACLEKSFGRELVQSYVRANTKTFSDKVKLLRLRLRTLYKSRVPRADERKTLRSGRP